MHDFDKLEIIGELNKAEFYPADGEWAAKLIGVYNVDGENWLFFHIRGEMEYNAISVKYQKDGKKIKCSPRRINVAEKLGFSLPEGEESVFTLFRFEQNNLGKSPVKKSDFPKRKIYVAKFPFPETAHVELV